MARPLMVLIAGLALAATGCSQWFTPQTHITGEKIEAQIAKTEQSEGDWQHTRTFNSATGVPEETWVWKGPTKTSDVRKGSSKGADVRGGDVSTKGGKAPVLDLQAGTVTGSTSAITSKLAQVFQGALVFVWIGAALLAGGLVMALAFKMSFGWGIAAAGAVVGGCGIVAGTYPWVLLVAFIVILAGGALWLWKTGTLSSLFTKAKTAVAQIVAGGEEFKKRLAEALPRIMSDTTLSAAQKAEAVVAVFHAAQDSEQIDAATSKMVDEAQNGGT